MKRTGTRRVKVADLKTNMFIRQALDQNRALYLGELIAAGVPMKDPIEVTDRGGMNNIVDGRHRKEGYELADVAEIDVRVLEFDDDAEMIAYAYRANVGGSLPPSPADTEHTVSLLIAQGKSHKYIAESLGNLPISLVRQYVNQVKSKITRQKLQQAVTAVTENGLTVPKAAEQFGVDPDKLKEVMGGKRKKQKEGIADLQRAITRTYKSLTSTNAALLRKVFEKLEDADMTAKQAEAIFEHLERLQASSQRAIAEWKQRFKANSAKK